MREDEAMTLFAVVLAITAFVAWADGRWRILGPLWKMVSWVTARIWKFSLIALGITATIVIVSNFRRDEDLVMFAAVLVFAAAVWVWAREFSVLMKMKDTDFPGRFDKAVWGLLMILCPPVGTILFHRHRTKKFSVSKEPMVELS